MEGVKAEAPGAEDSAAADLEEADSAAVDWEGEVGSAVGLVAVES